MAKRKEGKRQRDANTSKRALMIESAKTKKKMKWQAIVDRIMDRYHIDDAVDQDDLLAVAQIADRAPSLLRGLAELGKVAQESLDDMS